MKIEELESKKQEIIDRADEREDDGGPGLTAAEERKIDNLDEKIEELEGEANDVQNALDYLAAYTD